MLSEGSRNLKASSNLSQESLSDVCGSAGPNMHVPTVSEHMRLSVCV